MIFSTVCISANEYCEEGRLRHDASIGGGKCLGRLEVIDPTHPEQPHHPLESIPLY
jgi:hypothetical protein